MKRTIVGAALAATLVAAHARQALELDVINGDAGSFHVNAVLVSGPTEAVLVDTGFTRADALRIAARVLDSGKRLKAIYVSQADPDYYFGAATLSAIFPDVPVVAAPAVLDRMRAKAEAKREFWWPKMGANAPQRVLLPQPLSGSTLSIDGEVLEIRGLQGPLAHRPYVWIPSNNAVIGNIAVFSGLHVWTADTPGEGLRQAWLSQLDEIAALAPETVVPGHMAAGSATDLSAVGFTRDYLLRFDAEAGQAKDSGALIAAMQRAYPEAGLGIALDIGAKVATGELAW
ncbi:MAG: MBL fold metallo-hydrolase [Rhodocyclaceae bacterium]|nr:MBL fold metallo-hydrolase [Rhodocyclaceae bacterium]